MKTRGVSLVVLPLLLLSAIGAVAQDESPDGSDLISPAFAGVGNCANPLKEFAFVTYARDKAATTPICSTIISCTNLDSQPRTVVAQFFLGFGSLQVGGDAVLGLAPGDTGELATRADDHLGIRVINASAGASNFEGKGRICSDTKKLACIATLACDGPVLQTINLILKNKQLGD